MVDAASASGAAAGGPAAAAAAAPDVAAAPGPAAGGRPAGAGRLLDQLLQGEVDNPRDTVLGLKARATALKKQKQELTRQLRNAQKRNQRLKEKCKQLSDGDLLSVIRMREERANAADAATMAGAVANPSVANPGPAAASSSTGSDAEM